MEKEVLRGVMSSDESQGLGGGGGGGCSEDGDEAVLLLAVELRYENHMLSRGR
jgi:hypothetical protein